MFRRFVALFLVAGACSAYPHNDESTVGSHPPAESFVDPETKFDPGRGPVDPESPVSLERDTVDPERVHPETFPLSPERGPVEGVVDPERGPFPEKNVPVSEVPADISTSQDGPKPEGDLKTDATFWWPYYRSFWRYPSYTRRIYWTYPYYRYYRPRSYYRYYYW